MSTQRQKERDQIGTEFNLELELVDGVGEVGEAGGDDGVVVAW
jgi:hypothetical protein